MTIGAKQVNQNIDLTADVSGILPIANGGSSSSTATGTGSNVLATSPSITNLTLAAGTTALAPLKITNGVLLTTPLANTVETDSTNLYYTNDTTNGRGVIPTEQRFRLTATGTAITTTAANFFGANSNIPLVANAEYEIEIDAWFLKTTAGTVTWTLVNSAAPTSMTVQMRASPNAGISATNVATYLDASAYNVTTATYTNTGGALTTAVNHWASFKIRLRNGTGTSLQIRAQCSAGSLTPGINSNWVCRRLPASNVGSFAS